MLFDDCPRPGTPGLGASETNELHGAIDLAELRG